MSGSDAHDSTTFGCGVAHDPLEKQESTVRSDVMVSSSSHRSVGPRSRGFSLIEVMAALVIVGLLAGLVGLNVRGYLSRAKRDAAKADLATISQALEAFYTLRDRYPTNEEGLEALSEPSNRMPEPPLTKLPQDPWGGPYQYLQPGRSGPYEVFTLGADGREGGDPGTVDEDLGTWASEDSGS